SSGHASAGGGHAAHQFRQFSSTGTALNPARGLITVFHSLWRAVPATSPQPHQRPVEFARNFPLRAAEFVHTPSARSANIRSVMPANRTLRPVPHRLFHTVAGAA